MAALTQSRMVSFDTIKSKLLPIPAGVKVYAGGMACIDVSAGYCKPGASANANLKRVGVFDKDVDNSGGGSAVLVPVTLDSEIVVQWFDNATGANKVLATDLFSDVYIQDDHTVTKNNSGTSKAGRVWAVDALKGVAVEATDL